MKKMSRKTSFIDDLPQMDRKKAMRLVVYGLIIAVVCGTVLMTSLSVRNNSQDWKDLADRENWMNYWNGNIGYNDYLKKAQENQYTQYWMIYQYTIIGSIAKVGVNIGMILLVIGFLAFAVNNTTDERTRYICLIITGVILFVLMITTFYASISVTLG